MYKRQRVRAAVADDLPAVLALRCLRNADRSGPSILDLELFQAARQWLGDEILVAEEHLAEQHVAEQPQQRPRAQTGEPGGQQAPAAGALTGYVRYRPGTERVEILELGVDPRDAETGRALLAAAARPTQGRLRAVLPRTLRPLLDPWSASDTSTTGLMGRPLSAPALANALSHVWPARLARAGWQQARVPLAMADRGVTLRVTDAAVTAEPTLPESSPMPHPAEPSAAAPEDTRPLTGEQLSCLLLRGHDAATARLVADRRDRDVLAALCPEQDFVIWPAEQF